MQVQRNGKYIVYQIWRIRKCTWKHWFFVTKDFKLIIELLDKQFLSHEKILKYLFRI